MIKDEKFLIVASDSTHIVIQLEGILLDKGIPCRIIPLPTEISANCGLSLKVELEYEEKVKSIIKNEKTEARIFFVEKHGFKKEIEQIKIA